jgi:hypothetical protein
LPYVAFRTIIDLGWPDLNRLVRERDDGKPRLNDPESLNFWQFAFKTEEEDDLLSEHTQMSFEK